MSIIKRMFPVSQSPKYSRLTRYSEYKWFFIIILFAVEIKFNSLNFNQLIIYYMFINIYVVLNDYFYIVESLSQLSHRIDYIK